MAAPKTVLLVDDDREILGSLQAVLEAKGYRVLTARDGSAGLELAEKTRPDLVVVDMMMPKMSGFLVLDALKTRTGGSHGGGSHGGGSHGGGSHGGAKVIMVTANEGARHRAYAEMLGVDDYLRKPFALDDFLAAVTRLCPLPSLTAIDEARGPAYDWETRTDSSAGRAKD